MSGLSGNDRRCARSDAIMLKKITAILDSQPLQIFFAVWTGIYLVQIAKKEAGAPGTSELWWVIVAVAFAVFIV